MKFRERMVRFMAGRYGTDRLNRVLSVATIVLLVISLFTGTRGGFGSFVWLLALACLVWSTIRTFSRNIPARQKENAAWQRLERKLTGGISGWRTRFRQRKEYRFFRCPSCRTWLRVPKGKGRLNITCRRCGERFTRST